MDIITQKDEKIKNLNTFLELSGSGGLEELHEYNLPLPDKYYRHGDNWTIGYILDGVFWTKRGVEYLNDIILRFTLTFTDSKILSTDTKIIRGKNGKKLKDFQNLNSLKSRIKTPNHNKFGDSVFWWIKLYIEDYIRKAGEGNILPYSILEEKTMDMFLNTGKKRDRGTIRAKCRNVWNWYEKRGWTSGLYEKKYKDLKEYHERTKMTRTENMKKLNKQKAESTRRVVINVITGMFANDYKKKNGEWNVSKIAKEYKISRPSVYKYINEYETTKI